MEARRQRAGFRAGNRRRAEQANDDSGFTAFKAEQQRRRQEQQDEESGRRRELAAGAAERRSAAARQSAHADLQRRRESRAAQLHPATRAYQESETRKWTTPMSDREKSRQTRQLRNRPYTNVPLPGIEGPERAPTTAEAVVNGLDLVNSATTVTGATEKLFDFAASKVRTQRGLLRRFPRSESEKDMRRAGQALAVGSDAVGLVPGGGTIGAVGSGSAATLKARGEGASRTEAALRGVLGGGSSAAQGLIPGGGTAMSVINLANDTAQLAAGDERSDPLILKKLAEHKTQLAMLHSQYLEQGKEPPQELLHVKRRVQRHIDLARDRTIGANTLPDPSASGTASPPRRLPPARRPPEPRPTARSGPRMMTLRQLIDRDRGSGDGSTNPATRQTSGGQTITMQTTRVRPQGPAADQRVLHLRLGPRPQAVPDHHVFNNHLRRHGFQHPQDTRTLPQAHDSVDKGKEED